MIPGVDKNPVDIEDISTVTEGTSSDGSYQGRKRMHEDNNDGASHMENRNSVSYNSDDDIIVREAVHRNKRRRQSQSNAEHLNSEHIGLAIVSDPVEIVSDTDGEDTEVDEDDEDIEDEAIGNPLNSFRHRRLARVVDETGLSGTSDESTDVDSSNEDDDIVIVGADGKEEKVKTTDDLLKDSRKNDNSNLHEVTCPICMDPIKECVASPCGHFYCSDCVYKAMASSKVTGTTKGRCALCRKIVQYKDLVWLKFRYRKKV